MTDNEIIKALECCLADKMMCEQCPIQDECISHPLDAISAKYALDLINRQKAEIERLQETKERLMYNLKAVLDERTDHTEAVKDALTKVQNYLYCTPVTFVGEHGFHIVSKDMIKNLVKEMTEQRKEDEGK